MIVLMFINITCTFMPGTGYFCIQYVGKFCSGKFDIENRIFFSFVIFIILIDYL
jgi:hypothetical protein